MVQGSQFFCCGIIHNHLSGFGWRNVANTGHSPAVQGKDGEFAQEANLLLA